MNAALRYPESHSKGWWLGALLTLLSLGIAVWALEEAEWISPQPSLVLPLTLGAAAGTVLARTRLAGIWAFFITISIGLVLAVWQTVGLFPAMPGLSSWSRWLDAVARPADNIVAFAAFLVAVSALAGAGGAWFTVRRANPWPAFGIGAVIVILNLTNLPRDSAFVLPVYLILGLFLVVQTAWRPGPAARVRRIGIGTALSTALVAIAFILPQSPAENFEAGIDGGSLYSSVKKSALNIFYSVPSKIKTVRSSNQDAVSFNSAPDQGEAVRFIVTTPAPAYLRTRYYDTYSSAGWSNNALTEKAIAAGQTTIDVVPLAKSVVIRYEVENQVKTDIVLLAGQPSSLSIPAVGRSAAAPGGDDIMALISPHLLPPYQVYTVTARLPSVAAEDLAKSAGQYPAWVTARYLQLPRDLPLSVTLLSHQLTRGLTSSYLKVLAVKNYLSRLSYDLNGTDVLDGGDGVASFLSSQQGNCVNFASALVVMLRASGIPARFVQGYLGTELDDAGKHLLIRGKDAHAWAEVYFPEYGWIMVEVTPGRPADAFDPAAVGLAELTPSEGGDIFPVAPGGEVEDTLPPGSSGTTDSGPIADVPWLLIAALSLIVGILVVGIGGAFYLSRASRPAAAYARLGLFGRLFRLPPRAAETPFEFARRLGGRLPAEAGDIGFIAVSFIRIRYGPDKGARKEDCIKLGHRWRSLSLALLRRRFGLYASPVIMKQPSA